MLPQLAEERRPAPQPPSGGGQAGSDPVQGMGSLVLKPIQEQGRQPAQGASSPLLQQVKEKRLEPPGDVGRADDGPVEGGELQGPGVERGQRAQGVVCRD